MHRGLVEHHQEISTLERYVKYGFSSNRFAFPKLNLGMTTINTKSILAIDAAQYPR